jgi:hypothetical protein
LHAFLGKGDFVLGQIEGGADLGDVREEDKGGYTDWEGDYAVNDEEPVFGVSVDTSRDIGD